MKKFLTSMLLVTMVLAGCRNEQSPTTAATTLPPEPAVQVGICLPADAAPWSEQGRVMTERLTAAEHTVRVEYAQNDVQRQQEQVKKLVAENVECLVIAPVDSLSLLPVLEAAAQKNIPVIAYDRMPLQSSNVKLYIAFDILRVGKALGQKIAEEKALESAADEGRTCTVELFMGAPEAHEAKLFHEGLMAALQPYLNGGILVCNSGRMSFEDTCVPEGSATVARQRLQQYISSYYGGAAPDICVAASVDIAAGCGDILSGTDASIYTPDIRTDYSQLTTQCISAIEQLLAGNPVKGNGNTVHNGAITVESYLVMPELG